MITSGFIDLLSLALLLNLSEDLEEDERRLDNVEDISWFSFTHKLREKFLRDAQYKWPSCNLDLNDLFFLW